MAHNQTTQTLTYRDLIRPDGAIDKRSLLAMALRKARIARAITICGLEGLSPPRRLQLGQAGDWYLDAVATVKFPPYVGPLSRFFSAELKIIQSQAHAMRSAFRAAQRCVVSHVQSECAA